MDEGIDQGNSREETINASATVFLNEEGGGELATQNILMVYKHSLTLPEPNKIDLF